MSVISIYNQLSQIQRNLNAPKNRKNSFGNYKYRNCEDIIEAVKKLLPDGTSVVMTDEVLQIGDRYYIKTTASLVSADGSISTSAVARESLDKKGFDSAQITGAASSYSRKYALNGLFAIDDAQDADSDANHEAAKPNPHSKMVSDLMALFKANQAHQAAAYWQSIPKDDIKAIWGSFDQMQQQWIKDAVAANKQ